MPLLELLDGKWTAKMHLGQQAAFESEKRIVAVIAGGRSGKTSWGPIWLHREMQRKGPGDYLVVAPSFQLIDKAAGPELEHTFGHVLRLGEMRRSPSWQFVFSKAGVQALWGVSPSRQPRIIIGHADKPESLEAMSAKAAWLDEAGQSGFREGSWEAVQQRLSVDQGRTLITSKPYNLGWLKRLIYDPWLASGRNHPDIDVFTFDSLLNPAFPPEEYERARASLPKWRFDMVYRGLFTRPAGVIFEAFDSAVHCVRRFTPPRDWPRYAGIDFGAVNTAGVFLAAELDVLGKETGRHFVYKAYHPGRRGGVKLSPAGHVEAMLSGEPGIPSAVGGAPSEDEARKDFGAVGLYVAEPPVKDVEVGIDRTHAMIQAGKLLFFDDLTDLLDEVRTYSRELNEQGQPTEKIEDKSSFHLTDALRYICCRLYTGAGGSVRTGKDAPAADWTAPTRPTRQDDPDEVRESQPRSGGVGVGDGGALWPKSW